MRNGYMTIRESIVTSECRLILGRDYPLSCRSSGEREKVLSLLPSLVHGATVKTSTSTSASTSTSTSTSTRTSTSTSTSTSTFTSSSTRSSTRSSSSAVDAPHEY